MEVVIPFIQQVIAEQQAIYEKDGKCLEKPWDTALPTYYKGLQAARTAAVSENPIKWQEQTLTFWRDALNQLKSEPPQESPPQEKQVSQLFEELQTMDQMDRQPKAPQVPTLDEGKPW